MGWVHVNDISRKLEMTGQGSGQGDQVVILISKFTLRWKISYRWSYLGFKIVCAVYDIIAGELLSHNIATIAPPRNTHTATQ